MKHWWIEGCSFRTWKKHRPKLFLPHNLGKLFRVSWAGTNYTAECWADTLNKISKLKAGDPIWIPYSNVNRWGEIEKIEFGVEPVARAGKIIDGKRRNIGYYICEFTIFTTDGFMVYNIDGHSCNSRNISDDKTEKFNAIIGA